MVGVLGTEPTGELIDIRFVVVIVMWSYWLSMRRCDDARVSIIGVVPAP